MGNIDVNKNNHPDGSTYKGEMKDGKRHGHGTITDKVESLSAAIGKEAGKLCCPYHF